MQALANCKKALNKLSEFLELSKSNPSEIMQSGVIQAFEYNFELFWKLFQKIAAEEGQNANSPKQAFSFAYQMGFIKNETVWIDLLRDRNLTTHTYHEDMVKQIYTHILNDYHNAFSEALDAAAEYFKK